MEILEIIRNPGNDVLKLGIPTSCLLCVYKNSIKSYEDAEWTAKNFDKRRPEVSDPPLSERNMDLHYALVRWISANVRPSSYGFILAPYDRSKLDTLASTSLFPHLGELVDALFYAAIFGVVRLLLTYLVMKPLAISSMKIKFKSQQRVSSIDAFIARNGPIANIKVRMPFNPVSLPFAVCLTLTIA